MAFKASAASFSVGAALPLIVQAGFDGLHPMEVKAGNDVFRIAEETNRQFSNVISVVKAGELLGFIDTSRHTASLTDRGKAFVAAPPPEQKTLWCEQLLTLRLFREIHAVLQQQPQHTVDRDYVLETIVSRMPYEDYEKVFNTLIRCVASS